MDCLPCDRLSFRLTGNANITSSPWGETRQHTIHRLSPLKQIKWKSAAVKDKQKYLFPRIRVSKVHNSLSGINIWHLYIRHEYIGCDMINPLICCHNTGAAVWKPIGLTKGLQLGLRALRGRPPAHPQHLPQQRSTDHEDCVTLAIHQSRMLCLSSSGNLASETGSEKEGESRSSPWTLTTCQPNAQTLGQHFHGYHLIGRRRVGRGSGGVTQLQIDTWKCVIFP